MPRQPTNRRQRRQAEKQEKKARPLRSHKAHRREQPPVWQRALEQLEPVWPYWQIFWENREIIILPLIFFLMVVGTIYRIAFS